MNRVAIVLCCMLGIAVQAAQAQNAKHDADWDNDKTLNISELLRVIQLFNSGLYHCDPANVEDGFGTGPGDTTCTNHDADYENNDWRIGLSELLRIIQIYNAGGYFDCVSGEDSFCPGKPKNVVFLLLDTMRGDRLGGFRSGVPITPFLSEFAAEGAVFPKAIAPSSWTRPTMASLFTGKYPEALRGAPSTPVDARFFVFPEEQTLAEWFETHGYDRWAVQPNREGGAEFGMNQGFPDEQFIYPGFPPAAIISAEIENFMPQLQEPFFLLAQYVDPHTQYTPPTEYLDNPDTPTANDGIFGTHPVLSGADTFNLSPVNFPGFLRDVYSAFHTGSTPVYEPLTPAGREVMQYRYDAETRYLDDELEEIIGSLRAAYPNTLFLIVSDHGESLLDRDVIGHGHSLYQEQINIPLIIHGPGVDPAVVDHPAEALGALPALARLLDLTPSEQWQAPDVFEASASRPAFSFTNSFFMDIDITMSSVTRGNLKLIDDAFWARTELYDLDADPGETNNLAEQRPEDVQALMQLLEDHRTAVTP